MLGKKFFLTPDSAHGKRSIEKSRNSKERRYAITALVLRPYWRPHCKIWTILSIRISRAL